MLKDITEPIKIDEKISVQRNYILAKEFAYRAIEGEYGVPVLRNVAIGTTQIDGILNLNDRRTLIEVKYRKTPSWKRLLTQTINHFNPILVDKLIYIISS